MMVDFSKMNTIPDFLEKNAQQFPDKPALVFDKKSFSYQELNSQSELVANFLLSKTKPQDVVAILLPNSADFVISYFGVLKAGCIALLIPPNISDDKLKFQVAKTQPNLILTESKYSAKIERANLGPKLEVIDTQTLLGIQLSTDQQPRTIAPTDTSTIIFTSGTTSEPKGVQLQHTNVVNATKNIVEFLNLTPQEIDVNISALSHSFGLGHLHCFLAVGGTTVLFRDAINLKEILNAISANHATTLGAVPAILRLLLNNFRTEFQEHGKSLRIVQTNTSPLEKELIEGILNTLPSTNFSYYYGLTEASRSTFITFNQHADKLSSIGQASPNVQVEVRDARDQVCSPGELGEICIKGKMVIQEYWQNPSASEKVKAGWFHSGDVGYMDPEGFLYYKGRYNDLINVSGEKVSPEEVEDLIMKVPGVTDAAVIGIPDKILGEVIKAFISVSDKEFDVHLVTQLCRQKLESYKVPREVEIIKEIPRTDNGKLQRNKLKKSYTELIY